MIVNVLTTMENGAPLLPPMSADDGYCLHHADPVTGELRGGYSLLAEQNNGDVRVQVDVSPEIYTRMVSDPALNLREVEIILEENA